MLMCGAERNRQPVCRGGVAIPWSGVAAALGRPPITSHASVVLNNWRRLDLDAPVELGNIDTLQLFLGGLDEKWFYLTTVALEAKGAPALAAIVAARRAAQQGRIEALAAPLETIAGVLNHILAILQRIPDQCDPYIFYHRVRPFLAGWEAPGIVYQGVSDTPQRWAGGSAAQSSLLQAIDAGLGITYRNTMARTFLQTMRDYMPPPHRRFIQVIEDGPSLRQMVLAHQQSHPTLVERYNACIRALDRFRQEHMAITVRYILHQAPSEQDAKGTGGTHFRRFLTTVRKETTAHLIA